MYTLLISEDNSVTTSVYETIMQRSLNVDNVQILVDRYYKGIDLSDTTILMEYVLPSKRIFSTYLRLDDVNYKKNNYLKFTIPGNTMITAEAGDILVTFTFVKIELTDDETTAFVRKTQEGRIKITPISPWLDFVPDEHLTAIDQRLLAMEAAQNAQNALNQEMFENMAQDIALDEQNKKMHLTSRTGSVGDGVDLNKLSEIISTVIVGEDLDGVNDGITHLDNLQGVKIVNLDKLV